MKSKTFNLRAFLAFSHDVIAAGLAWALAYWLRFNLAIPDPFFYSMARNLWILAPIFACVFWGMGLYRGIWRYASIPDLKRILLAVGLAGLISAVAMLMLGILDNVPRSVLLLQPILLIFIMGGDRLLYRAWKEHHFYNPYQASARPVLVLGGGEAAANLVRELARSRLWRVVGILDDDKPKQGRLLSGVKILGGLESLAEWAQRFDVEHVIVAMPSVSYKTRRHILALCSDAALSVLTVPGLEDLMSGKVTISQIRQIEVEDLLGREPVLLDDEGLHGLLTNQVVMVTGGGGSIGAELSRQIAKFQPRQLIFLEQNEFALYLIEQEFTRCYPQLNGVFAIADVKNSPRVEQLIAKYRPSVIFHAAAYKHVPLMEHENSWQALLNNVLGTYIVAQAAINYQVAKLVFVSTDKAVNPTNVMGASKRIAEMVCQALQSGQQTRFIMVRFGNVLGSNGSVIPKFHQQIAAGGPVTVTHSEITRYFMSIPEAAQLVLQAGLMGEGGEIFVLDMGEPIKIADLASDMIRLSGFSKDEIKIVFTGLRPGEKLYEELLTDDEHTLPTQHPKLRIAKARPVELEWLQEVISQLNQPHMLSDEAVKRLLSQWLAEYQPFMR